MNAPFDHTALAEPIQTQAFVDTLPPIYSLETIGTCMEPFIRSGAKLVFGRDDEVRPFDVAAIWWSPGMNAPGSFQIQVKQIVLPSVDGEFAYRILNPRRSLSGHRSQVMAIHRCLGFRRADGSLQPVNFASLIQQLVPVCA